MNITSHLKYSPGTTIRIVPTAYFNDRLALRCEDTETGEPIATATVNLVNEVLGTNEIAVKNYSESEGMETTLIRAGLIDAEPVRRVPSGFITVGIFNLTSKANTWLHQEQST